MRQLRFFVAFTVLGVSSRLAAQEQALRYLPDKTPPVVVSSSASSTTVQFGPARLTFPAGWSFQLAGALSKGTGPNRTQAYVSVMRTSTGSDAAPLTPAELQAAKRRITSLVKDACGIDTEPEIHEMTAGSGRTMLAGDCEESQQAGATSYYLHYEIYSKGGVVQLFGSGAGRSLQAHQVFDPIALSHEW